MARDYPLEKVRNFGIVARVVAAMPLHENPRFSTGYALLSDTGKLQFSRPLSNDVGHVIIFP
jgi:hypothetical protein